MLANAVSKKDGKTPLHWAAYSGHKEAVQLLLDYKSEINRSDKLGVTPLQGAAFSGRPDITRLLIDKGADINAMDNYGTTILDAASYVKHAASHVQRCATASLLLERGAAVNGGKTGFLPVNRFISIGDIDCTRKFLAHGAKLNTRDVNGYTAMHWVAKGAYVSKEELLAAKLYLGSAVQPLIPLGPARYKELFDLLVESGSNPNARNNLGETPLHLAAIANNLVVAKALIAFGADISARDRNEETALFFAVRKGSTDIVRLLVSSKTDANVRGKNGYTPLIVAIRWGEDKAEIGRIAQYLVDSGADVNARKPGGGWGAAGSDGQTALQQASEFGYASVVELLIRRGADVNQEFKDGRTPLYWAARNGRKDIVEILIRSGANVNAKASGRSALMAAMAARQERRSEIYELLVKHGAKE